MLVDNVAMDDYNSSDVWTEKNWVNRTVPLGIDFATRHFFLRARPLGFQIVISGIMESKQAFLTNQNACCYQTLKVFESVLGCEGID